MDFPPLCINLSPMIFNGFLLILYAVMTECPFQRTFLSRRYIMTRDHCAILELAFATCLSVILIDISHKEEKA